MAEQFKNPLEKLRLDCPFTCAECGSKGSGWIGLDGTLTVCDSGNFIIAGNDPPVPICDGCAAKKFGSLVNGMVDSVAAARKPALAKTLLAAIQNKKR